jgi:hypothetical protein
MGNSGELHVVRHYNHFKVSGYTMCNAKNDSAPTDGVANLEAVGEACGKRLLTKDIVTQLCKGNDNLAMHPILHCDHNGVAESRSIFLGSQQSRSSKLLPCFEHQLLTNGCFVRMVKCLASGGSRLCDSDDDAFRWIDEGVSGIGL